MLTVDFNALEAPDRGPGMRAAFPISSAEGTAALAVVWIELVPGGILHEHTDSAEELLFVVEGEVGAERPGEPARDREAEAGAAAPRLLGPREPLEELRHEVGRHARPTVLDGEPERAARVPRAHEHGRLAVLQRVADQVADD